MTIKVVYDAALIVAANAFADPEAWYAWPHVPPISDYPEQDCLGIIANSPDFGNDVTLVTHRSVLAAVASSLANDIGLDDDAINEFLTALIRMATAAGQPPVANLIPARGFEGHRGDVVGLAEGPHAARLIVSADPQLLGQADQLRQRATHVLSPEEFARRVDMQRRVRLLDG